MKHDFFVGIKFSTQPPFWLVSMSAECRQNGPLVDSSEVTRMVPVR